MLPNADADERIPFECTQRICSHAALRAVLPGRAGKRGTHAALREVIRGGGVRTRSRVKIKIGTERFEKDGSASIVRLLQKRGSVATINRPATHANFEFIKNTVVLDAFEMFNVTTDPFQDTS